MLADRSESVPWSVSAQSCLLSGSKSHVSRSECYRLVYVHLDLHTPSWWQGLGVCGGGGGEGEVERARKRRNMRHTDRDGV